MIKDKKWNAKAKNFGIVLICDGIDRIPDEFWNKLKKFGLFHESLWYNTVTKLDINGKHVKRTFDKSQTFLVSEEQYNTHSKDKPNSVRMKYDYTTK